MNFFQGLSRPLRLAGFALIGLALVAVVLGVVTSLSGGTPDQTAAPAPTTGESATSAPPGSSGPVTTAPLPPATTTQPPPAATSGASPAPGQPGGVPADQASAKWVPVRVYNNSMISGLANRAADEFRAQGWNIAEAGNYPYGVIPTTTAYYTPGTDEETAAKALASAFGMKAEPRFAGIQDSTTGVIVIVTNDYKGVQSAGKG
jgi:LytR cell envelope-related transcriptional attenuator